MNRKIADDRCLASSHRCRRSKKGQEKKAKNSASSHRHADASSNRVTIDSFQETTTRGGAGKYVISANKKASQNGRLFKYLSGTELRVLLMFSAEVIEDLRALGPGAKRARQLGIVPIPNPLRRDVDADRF